MTPDLRYTAAYTLGAVLFLAAELNALRHHDAQNQTFTSQTRWLEAHVPAPAKWAMRVAILGVTMWAGGHLAEGLS